MAKFGDRAVRGSVAKSVRELAATISSRYCIVVDGDNDYVLIDTAEENLLVDYDGEPNPFGRGRRNFDDMLLSYPIDVHELLDQEATALHMWAIHTFDKDGDYDAMRHRWNSRAKQYVRTS